MEVAVVAPFLLLILLGLIESGNSLAINHKMAVLTREGANIASRGTVLTETLNVVMASGDEIELTENGGAVITRIVVVDGDPVVDAQEAYPGYEGSSRLGLPDSTVVALEGLNVVEGQVFHAVEIIYKYKALTPVAGVLPDGWTEEIYERAIF